MSKFPSHLFLVPHLLTPPQEKYRLHILGCMLRAGVWG